MAMQLLYRISRYEISYLNDLTLVMANITIYQTQTNLRDFIRLREIETFMSIFHVECYTYIESW